MDVIERTRAMVAIESVTYREGPFAEWLGERWTEAGLDVSFQELPGAEPGVVGRRANVLGVTDPGEPLDLVFTTHIDTVPPFVPLREDDAFLYGRGTCDAKGILAAQWGALERLRKKGHRRLGLLGVVGEETNSDGAKAVGRMLPKARFIVDGEPTRLIPCSAAKGILGLTVRAKGVAAHSAYPERGHSATHDLVPALAKALALELPWLPEFGRTTLNVGKLAGGVAPNVLAPAAEAVLMLRLGAPSRDVIAALSPVFEGLESEITTISEPKAIFVPAGYSGVPVSFASDVPYLAPLGTTLLVGPGDIHDAHTAGEKIGKRELEDAVSYYEALGERLLQTPPPAT